MSYIDLYNNLGGQFQLRILDLLMVQRLDLCSQPDHSKGSSHTFKRGLGGCVWTLTHLSQLSPHSSP